MTNNQPGILHKNLSVLFSLGVITAFFLNWVKWGAVPVSARHMATGHFYTLAETNFGIGNPFPEMVVANAIFWLIPALGVVVLLFVLARNTYAGFYGAVAGALTLGLAMAYILFTNELQLFDPGIKLPTALRPGIYLAIICGAGLISCSWRGKRLQKLLFFVLPLVISYLAFSQIKKSQVSEKTAATSSLKADFTVNALDLIGEFVNADSTANQKYRGKVLVVNGKITEINGADSSATLSMADSTGSYVIFDFEKNEAPKVKAYMVGEEVSVTGVCSGSIYSEILETQTISFKQSIINNKQIHN
ncbi:MAG: hypothetical protein EOO06_14060 [Chitinophagaceae bacterium]|nr:MAG: hypothetical protein EOO06_14060 [Chitinophagaceae bacterium]